MIILDTDSKNLPAETGWYWAKKDKFQWHNLLVQVSGESPYFYVSTVIDTLEDKLYKSGRITCTFGPKIENPDK